MSRASHTIRSLGRATLVLAALVGAALASAQTPVPQERPWPQSFAIQGTDRAEFGFAVTQPGPIAIDVQADGAPVRVELIGPSPSAQAGQGHVVLQYIATPADVQRGVIWHIAISSAVQNGAARGSIVVHHASAAAYGAAMRANESARAQRAAALSAAGARLEGERNSFMLSRLAGFAQAENARRAAAYEAVRPTIEKLRGAGAIGTRGLALPARSATPIAVAPVQSTLNPVTPTIVSTTSPSVTTVGQAGTGIQSVAAPPPAPSISQAPSPASGTPGTLVMVSGSGFGIADPTHPMGAIRFVIGAGLDIPAAVHVWTDTQIIAEVPTKPAGICPGGVTTSPICGPSDSIGAYNGTLYVIRYLDGAASNGAAFQFLPTLAHRQLPITPDRNISSPAPSSAADWGPGGIHHFSANPFFSVDGDDQLYLQTYLQNGWTVEGAQAFCDYANNACHGGVNNPPAATQIGSNYAYTKVHWWANPTCAMFCASEDGDINYTYATYIVGPKNVPDGVACKAAPCSDP